MDGAEGVIDFEYDAAGSRRVTIVRFPPGKDRTAFILAATA
jgi:hypothetical protein